MKPLPEEIAYHAFMDAINYRVQVLAEHLNSSAPKELKEGYQEKLDYLLKLKRMMS